MPEFITYTTKQKDALDMIALKLYEDEVFATNIAQVNPKYADVILYDANIELKIPILEVVPPESLPPWRRR